MSRVCTCRWRPNLKSAGYAHGFLPTLMVIALGVFPANCGVRWFSQWMPAATSAAQKACCADTDSLSSGAIYASIPESDMVAAVSPAASTRTPPVLSICDGTLFHPDDFNSESSSLSKASGSGSGKTAKAKFCPAKCFVSAISLSCCSRDRKRGCLNLARARAASEAALSALAVRSFCFASSVSTRCWAAFASDASFSRPATRISECAARSPVTANSLFRYVSLTLPIQTSNTVETTPIIRPMISPQLAMSYNRDPKSSDGHTRMPPGSRYPRLRLR
jgi:hypothetical protein